MAWTSADTASIYAPSSRRRNQSARRRQVPDDFCWYSPPFVDEPGFVRRRRKSKRRRRNIADDSAAFPRKFYSAGRGLYRVFNPEVFRFYRDNTGPPQEGDTPFDTNATLPYTPDFTYADGTWWVSVSKFNGVLDSGFLPRGPAGETYIRLDIAAGQKILSPPTSPIDAPVAPGSWWLQKRAGGVVAVLGNYIQTGDQRAEEWAIAYTTDDSTPPEDTPDYTVTIPAGGGVHVLEYELPAQSHGTTVKVRVQVRRNDGSWVYSEDSVVQEIQADALGPKAPDAGTVWPGRTPTE